MKMTLPLIYALALSMVCGHIEAGRVQAQMSDADTPFECPPECLECCHSPWYKNWGFSNFKCILRRHDEKIQISRRKCEAPSPRNSLSSQLKAHCEYNSGEEKAPPKCSEEVECCCAVDGNWHEEQCIDSSSSTVQYMANHTGRMETFAKRSAQTFQNRRGECVAPGNTHHQYHSTSFPSSSGRPKGTSNVRTGCCLETESKRVNHRWSTTHTRRIGKVSSMYSKPHTEGKTYTICKKFEVLNYCSDDKGITSNGKSMYDSQTRTEEGICIGDQQPTADGLILEDAPIRSLPAKCPAGTFTGDWCRCDAGCGTTSGGFS
jgi:hypothetical protein